MPLPREPGAASVEAAILAAPESGRDDLAESEDEAMPLVRGLESDLNDSEDSFCDDNDEDHSQYEPLTQDENDEAEFSVQNLSKQRKKSKPTTDVKGHSHQIDADADDHENETDTERANHAILKLELDVKWFEDVQKRRNLNSEELDELEKINKQLREMAQRHPNMFFQESGAEVSGASRIPKTRDDSGNPPRHPPLRQPDNHKRKSDVQENLPKKKKIKLTIPSKNPGKKKQEQANEVKVAAQNQLDQLKKQACDTPEVEMKRLNGEMRNLKLAITAFGDKLVEAKNGCWLLEGMKTPLYGYQLDGAGWMVRQERSKALPQGGILADEMGCGKTITTLSVIVSKLALKKDKIKTVLILVQSDQMASQWLTQIQKHCRKLSAFRYRRQSRLNIASHGTNQVMLATYNEVERAWSRVKNTMEELSQKEVDDVKDDEIGSDDEIEGDQLLFSVPFHRLILDECQVIKNHNSATAKAVFNLKSHFQWLISATPAPNKPDEYYSYLKVLKMQKTNSLREFRREWMSSTGSGGTKLETTLDRIQLRRTHEAKIAGVRIFADVPNSIYTEVKVSLSGEERLLYDIVVEPLRKEMAEKQEQLRDNEVEAIEDDGGDRPERGRGYLVTKILHLYKLTAHPFLLESLMRKQDFKLGQIQEVRENLRKRSHEFKLFEQLKEVGVAVEGSGTERSSSRESQDVASQSLTESLDFNMDPQMEVLLGERAKERKCHFCPGETIPADAMLSECGHAFCKEDFVAMTDMANFKKPDGPIQCTICKKPVGEAKEVDQSDLVEAYAALSEARSGYKATKKSKGKKPNKKPRKRGDDFNGYQPKGEHLNFLKQSDRDHPKIPLTQSAKTREIKNTISRWQDDAPDDKIIIFTQWILMGMIIGRMLEDEGISFLYYFGEMSDSEKTKNLKTFEKVKEVKVIIMGFKCAGQGLDMPYANRVILVDPWWNEDGEKQAFARVLRQTQKKTTFLIRLLAENSIDMRISDIQASKRDMDRLIKEDDPVKRVEIEYEFLNKIVGHRQDDTEAAAAKQKKVAFLKEKPTTGWGRRQ